ncbi:hypothetical protein KIW84_043212 [Lathyrus oleraceus]|uniref:RNase H type-1 domain-containing protein n=1 Tax=Pisum sativum TaxID=3888 RepID=A0A9D4XD77_PEA|nr:hypothetical protein KIW84_043212 [Pisum sativum]
MGLEEAIDLRIKYLDVYGDSALVVNQIKDALATLASMIVVKYCNKVPNLIVMSLDRLTHVFAVEEVKDEKPWYFDIKCFLQSQIYSSVASLKDKKTLRRLADNFYLNGDV